MSEAMKERIVDETNGLAYKQEGDYWIPDLELPEVPEGEVTYYGLARQEYLEEYRPRLYLDLSLSWTMKAHLLEIQKEAEEMEETIMKRMKKAEGVTEELKAKDPMEWVGRMNNIKARAREIVMSEVVYK